MSPLVRRIGVAGVLAGAATLAVVATSGAEQEAVTSASPKKITAQGVGPIKLGDTATSLRARNFIGPLHAGCELAGPGTRAANVRAFQGTVGFTQSNPRKVNVIAVVGRRPSARGVHVGETLADIKHAYAKVKVDKSQRPVFGGDFVTIPKSAGGKIMFFIDTASGRIQTIGVPIIPVCE